MMDLLSLIEQAKVAAADPAFTRAVSFSSAYDRRDPNPSKNYGIHGVDIIFTVRRGGEGIEWTLFTGWQLPGIGDSKALPAGCCYHMLSPQYEDQTPSTEGCHITGGTCYSDSTYCTEDLFALLRSGGDTAVFEELERRLSLYQEY